MKRATGRKPRPKRPPRPPVAERRARIAAYLAARGPTYGATIRDELGMGEAEFWEAINCRRFDVTGKGYVDRGDEHLRGNRLRDG